MFKLENFTTSKENIHWVKVYTTILLRIVLSCIAVYLSWDCNKLSNTYLRVLMAIVAFCFAEIYVLYYAIYRSFMGNKCY